MIENVVGAIPIPTGGSESAGIRGHSRGHMSLHARNVAIMTGVSDALIDLVEKMVEERKIRVDGAKELVEKYKKQKCMCKAK